MKQDTIISELQSAPSEVLNLECYPCVIRSKIDSKDFASYVERLFVIWLKKDFKWVSSDSIAKCLQVDKKELEEWLNKNSDYISRKSKDGDVKYYSLKPLSRHILDKPDFKKVIEEIFDNQASYTFSSAIDDSKWVMFEAIAAKISSKGIKANRRDLLDWLKDNKSLEGRIAGGGHIFRLIQSQKKKKKKPKSYAPCYTEPFIKAVKEILSDIQSYDYAFIDESKEYGRWLSFDTLLTKLDKRGFCPSVLNLGLWLNSQDFIDRIWRQKYNSYLYKLKTIESKKQKDKSKDKENNLFTFKSKNFVFRHEVKDKIIALACIIKKHIVCGTGFNVEYLLLSNKIKESLIRNNLFDDDYKASKNKLLYLLEIMRAHCFCLKGGMDQFPKYYFLKDDIEEDEKLLLLSDVIRRFFVVGSVFDALDVTDNEDLMKELTELGILQNKVESKVKATEEYWLIEERLKRIDCLEASSQDFGYISFKVIDLKNEEDQPKKANDDPDNSDKLFEIIKKHYGKTIAHNKEGFCRWDLLEGSIQYDIEKTFTTLKSSEINKMLDKLINGGSLEMIDGGLIKIVDSITITSANQVLSEINEKDDFASSIKKLFVELPPHAELSIDYDLEQIKIAFNNGHSIFDVDRFCDLKEIEEKLNNLDFLEPLYNDDVHTWKFKSEEKKESEFFSSLVRNLFYSFCDPSQVILGFHLVDGKIYLMENDEVVVSETPLAAFNRILRYATVKAWSNSDFCDALVNVDFLITWTYTSRIEFTLKKKITEFENISEQELEDKINKLDWLVRLPSSSDELAMYHIKENSVPETQTDKLPIVSDTNTTTGSTEISLPVVVEKPKLIVASPELDKFVTQFLTESKETWRSSTAICEEALCDKDLFEKWANLNVALASKPGVNNKRYYALLCRVNQKPTDTPKPEEKPVENEENKDGKKEEKKESKERKHNSDKGVFEHQRKIKKEMFGFLSFYHLKQQLVENMGHYANRLATLHPEPFSHLTKAQHHLCAAVALLIAELNIEQGTLPPGKDL